MRMSRKGRHRLEEAKRFEEEGRKRWAPVAFRMSRKRRKRLAAAQDGAAPRLKRFVLQNMRMTRSRKRKMREDAALRQSAQVASISALALLPPVAGEAAGISNAMNEIPAALDILRNERNRIRDFHEAQRNAQEAAAALNQAEQDLEMARQDRLNAEKGLAEAQKNLENAQLNLQRVAQELANAQVESAQRTKEAIAAQQAVADFAPQVWAQETAVQAAQARRQSLQASYEQLGQELGYLRDERGDLEERIRKAWESVGYAQNRLQDVIAMVNRTQATVPEQSAEEAQWQAYDNQLAELDSAVDSAESLLDELNSQLDALQDAREAAEDAERDARELVKDLQEQQADGERDLKDSEQYVAEAEKWNEEAVRGVETAEANLTTTRDWKTKADYDLEHFGEGKGFSTGFEYYNWHGAGQPHGHQLYQPIEFYATEKKWDFSLSTGWLNSDTGLTDGHVSGWTDTTLGITYKNNHKINDVHYSLNINVPTGKENAHQNAMIADNLARFNSFSEGWQFTPGIEVTHRFTERDSLTGRLGYTFRGNYKYRRSYAESEKNALQSEMLQISNISVGLKRIAAEKIIDVNDETIKEQYQYWSNYRDLLQQITSSEDNSSLLDRDNMQTVLSENGITDEGVLNAYYKYTKLLYDNSDEGDKEENVKKVAGLSVYDLAGKIAELGGINETEIKLYNILNVNDFKIKEQVKTEQVYKYWTSYKSLLKEITASNSAYSLANYNDMLRYIENTYFANGALKEATQDQILSVCDELLSDGKNNYADMLNTLCKYGAISGEIINNYAIYTALLYRNGTEDGKAENVKSASELNIYDLVERIYQLEKEPNVRGDDEYIAWVLDFKNKVSMISQFEDWLEYVVFAKFVYSLENDDVPIELLQIFFSPSNVQQIKTLLAHNITDEYMSSVLDNYQEWKELSKNWGVDEKKGKIANLVNYLMAEKDNIIKAISYGLFDELSTTIKEIEDAKNGKIASPVAAAYLLSTKTITDIETQEEIDPGNKFQQELEYRHIGEDNQLSVKFTHVNATHADYKSTLTSFTDDAGHVYSLNMPYGSGRNYDGEDWTLQVFGSQDIDRKNSLQYYVMGNYQAADTGGTHRYYGGLGWTHQFDKKQSGYVLLNYGETHGQSYNWRTGKYDSGRVMKAIILGYDYRLNDTSELRAKLERYNISGSAADSYHGWKMSLMWNKSF